MRQKSYMADVAPAVNPDVENTPPATPSRRSWIELMRACSVMVLTLSVWFSSNTFLAEISSEYDLSSIQGSLLTASVNVGFMIAATTSSIVLLPDRILGNRLVVA